ncbi:hypothetical protein HDZ31DRAFT_62121 [Schizophyllum fasciatum]
MFPRGAAEVQRTLSVAGGAARRYRHATRRPSTYVRALDHTWLWAPRTRTYASKSKRTDTQEPEDFLSPKHSTWDSVFADLPDSSRAAPLGQRARARPRRQAMTAREISAFDEMFDMIFDAVSEKHPPARPAEVAAGRRGADALLGRLRLDAKKLRFTDAAAEALDRKLEAIDLCDTDHQLLTWAVREVFGEPAPDAAAAAATDPTASPAPAPPTPPDPAYPHLVARLMRTFREKYADPHLALSVFDHAKRRSVASYVAGCGTRAYNELLATRWAGFRDLRGVADALEEMKVNGVPPDAHTRRIVERVRADVAGRALWLDDDVPAAEVAGILHRIERLASHGAKDWKGKAEHLVGDEGFGDWENVRKDSV